ncbi:two-component system phosphate regulon sensor histidine kinase PhoR [Aliiruegeria haliotis]|uniref:histidine kinase n=1 Tax=Aliiruegeria haliotis TaxID=1280846 RepID=A0A2T0S029_9RHOB|nr:ATP-binding protein [Aliiruegeria haliotis]PRY26788.1 two-component system phosphate regulon sensor histidine kinase PhoR [Aliiruegeria haliotis]
MTVEPTSALLAAVPMPIVLIGSDKRIHALNAGAEELFGASAIGRHYITVLRQPALLNAIEEAHSRRVDSHARYLDTNMVREAVYRVLARPLAPDPDGSVKVLVSFQDVTDLEQAGQMRRDFVANVSHELKTPLTALSGFIETLRGAARDDPAARERFLAIMEREAGRMNRLVSDLLSLSRVESAERQRPTGQVDMAALVDSTLVTLRALSQADVMEFEVERINEGPFVVSGDADQLQQVVTNLVENAIKYGADGGKVAIRLEHKTRELAIRGPGIKLEIEDYGEGFDPIHIPRLTERFYRVDGHRSREMGGTGLGLAIVKHIINRHRGRLKIDSEPGQGARFTVLLPAAGP